MGLVEPVQMLLIHVEELMYCSHDIILSFDIVLERYVVVPSYLFNLSH